MSKQMNSSRLAKWDNVKLFLMLCVVIGHSLYYFNSSSELSRGIYLFLYTFNMPVFIFVTGVFAQKTVKQRRYENILGFLFIYLVIKFTETIGEYLAKGKLQFHFLWEAGPAWYALAVAVFMLVTILIQNYNWKVILGVSVFVGCVAGLDTHFGDHYASMRICVFYPIFLAGYYLGETLLDPDSKKFFFQRHSMRILALAILIGIAWVCIKYCDVLYPYINFIKGKTSYSKLDIGIKGVIYRFVNYVLWSVIIFSVIHVCPRRNHIWTWLGSRTLSIYVWHYLVIIILVFPLNGREIIMEQCPTLYVWATIVIACILTVLTAYLPSFDIRKKLTKNN